MPRVAAVAAVLLLASAQLAAAADVITGTSSNFDKIVKKSDGVVFVEFFAPWCGHCKNLAPEYEKAAGALAGIAKLVAVDATVEQSLAGQYGVQGYPTVKMFVGGGAPQDYQGARTAQGITDAALQAAQQLARQRLGGGGGGGSSGSGSGGGGSGPVVELTDGNFAELVYGSEDPWMVEFYAPWCGHCKNLAPEWKRAASEMEGDVKFGALDATAHQSTASQYGIQGFPTIKYFAAGPKSGPHDAQDYQGGRTASDLVAQATILADEAGGSAEAIELLSQDIFDEQCGGKKICIISVLPHVLDSGAAGRNEYLEMLGQVAHKKRKLPFRFLWTSVGEQPDLEEKLGLTFGFPAAVAVNVNKERFAVHTGAFDAERMSKFCEKMMAGRAVSNQLRAFDVRTAEAWDGEEGVVEEDDEDDELMRELLGEL